MDQKKITAASTISIETNVHTGSLERQIHLFNMLFTKIFTLLSWCIYESDIYLLILLFKINGNTVYPDSLTEEAKSITDDSLS